MPLRITARVAGPNVWTTERKSTSTAGRHEFSGGSLCTSRRTCSPSRTTHMWWSPGAIHACPGCSTAPELPSCTWIGNCADSRSASNRSADDQEIERTPQAVDVRAVVDVGQAQRLFGWDEVHGPHDRSGLGQ